MSKIITSGDYLGVVWPKFINIDIYEIIYDQKLPNQRIILGVMQLASIWSCGGLLIHLFNTKKSELRYPE